LSANCFNNNCDDEFIQKIQRTDYGALFGKEILVSDFRISNASNKAEDSIDYNQNPSDNHKDVLFKDVEINIPICSERNALSEVAMHRKEEHVEVYQQNSSQNKAECLVWVGLFEGDKVD